MVTKQWLWSEAENWVAWGKVASPVPLWVRNNNLFYVDSMCHVPFKYLNILIYLILRTLLQSRSYYAHFPDTVTEAERH